MRLRHIPAFILAAVTAIGCGSSENVYSWDEDLNMRLAYDFCESRDEVKDYIMRYIPDVSDEQIDAWTASGKLESMDIDGQTMYFANAGANLFRIDPECNAIKNAGSSASVLPDFESEVIIRNIVDVIHDADTSGHAVCQPKRMKVKYSITVEADAVPAGETIRCWLPFPRKDVSRQTEVEFLGANTDNFIFSDPDCVHSTLYMEKTAVAGEPTVFEEEFSFVSSGEWYRLSAETVKPYDTTTEFYKEYTSEQAPHIVFTEQMRALSARLTDGLDNPYDKAMAIFTWIHDNFPWASAREYSTIPCIPQYVLDNGHGDCGQVTLLFMTLCRIAGIPAHWQSGFSMTPGEDNLHDWSEIWFEGYGWVPMDMSRGLVDYAAVRTIPLTTEEGRVAPSEYRPDYAFTTEEEAAINDDVLRFHLGGIDSYRMIVNSGFGGVLSPAKKYPRSETVDFQRGEVEWDGGNLYFSQWRRKMTITYSE